MDADASDRVSGAVRPAKKNVTYWRSLAELSESSEFEALLHREFPRQAFALGAALNRRDFLKLMGAALALAGLQACTPAPREKIVPFVQQPEHLIPGKPLFYATSMTLAGYATGLLIETHEGRPTKVEGNPKHPASLGASDAFAQASLLTLYDPDRAGGMRRGGQAGNWEQFLTELRAALDVQRTKHGSGLRILTETVTSPTLADQLQRILQAFPQAHWHQYEPLARNNAHAGALLAFGQIIEQLYRFDRADVVLSLDADFLAALPGSLRYARDFSTRRKVQGPPGTAMNRLYAVESTPSISGSLAEHRLPLRPSAVGALAANIAGRLGVSTSPSSLSVPAAWLDALVADLQAHRGASLVVAGEAQPPAVHALAHALNQTLGNVSQTVSYTAPAEANPVDQIQSLRELVAAMQGGQVELLLMLGGNPAYTAPADLAFGAQVGPVPLSIHLGLHDDETSALSSWHIPEAHFLESWSDARAFDGTAGLVQPVILPLYGGHSAHALLDAFSSAAPRADHDIVKAYWQSRHPAEDFEGFWRTALHDGLIAGSASAPATATFNAGAIAALSIPAPSTGPELVIRADYGVYDGRFANNAWLQELPKPITKLTWANAALVSPLTAQRLGLSASLNGQGGERGGVVVDSIELQLPQGSLSMPAWIVPGQPDDTVTVHLGYGRTRAGGVGSGVGLNTYPLRSTASPWFSTGLEIRKSGERVALATTQFDQLLEGRDLVRSATLQEFTAHPTFAQADQPSPGDSMYPPVPYEGYKWGMAIDLNACTGCSACVVACQAENNIPVVGKTEVMRARSMHWLRIDRYHKGDPNNPEVYHQPVPCMHCENAPCEPVCPVGATTHSSEGLNEMTYNRCVGTRYCSNNCPYKVRRFNFVQYQDWSSDALKLVSNPNVTVRSRGVMEKCTYCVQRIVAGRISAEKEGRRIRDGEIITACAAACPNEAIIFGDLNDPGSRVAQLKAAPRNYALLAELNTRPRTTYLAAVRNQNPAITTG
jgi:MoCo/4Fe-4S cofactor protein with predicted Tat translocation signal